MKFPHKAQKNTGFNRLTLLRTTQTVNPGVTIVSTMARVTGPRLN